MSRTWTFTDLEFVVGWEPLREGLLPEPLTFRSRTPLYDDYLREKHQARERLRARADGSLESVLEAIARPDIRVLVCAEDGRDPDRPAGSVRLLATRLRGNGYVVTQLPGETVGHSGGFTITECEALSLADAVVAALPAVAAGRAGVVQLDDAEPDRRPTSTIGSSDRAERYRGARFLNTPATTVGKVEVIQGESKFGPRGITRKTLRWRDHVDDGRYVITGQPPTAYGVDARRFATLINTEIAQVVQAIRDENP